jgi:D-amino-acid dehydrogenase
MVQETDALIIGGGAIGICCAHYLNESGKDVLVVEKNDICAGSSYGNAGLIVPSYSIPLAAPGVLYQGLKWMLQPQSPFYIKPRLNRKLLAWLWLFRGACNYRHVRQSIPVLHGLHSASLNLFDELADLEGLDFALEKRGLLELFKTRKGFENGIKEAHLIKKFGIQNEILEKDKLRNYLGETRTSAVGGAFLPHDAHLVPDLFVNQMARHFEKKGGHIRTACEVLDFKSSGRKVTGVKTTRGEILTQNVIIAGGAWSAELARKLQLDLPMQPAKGYSISFKRPTVYPSLPLALAEARVVLTPMADLLRLAGTLELAGYDESIDLTRVKAILDTVRVYLPELDLDSLELVEIWRGLRPCSPDGLPYIGRMPRYDNAILATGHGMLGISLAPITGQIVSRIATRQTPEFNLAPLSAERFTLK